MDCYNLQQDAEDNPGDLGDVLQRSRDNWLCRQDVDDILNLHEYPTLSLEPVEPFEEGLFLYHIWSVLNNNEWLPFDDGKPTQTKTTRENHPLRYTVAWLLLDPIDEGMKSTYERRVYKLKHIFEDHILAHYRLIHTINGEESEEESGDNAEDSSDDDGGDSAGNDGEDLEEAGISDADSDEDDGVGDDDDDDSDSDDAPPSPSCNGHYILEGMDVGVKNGRRPLLQLLQPHSSRYFSQDDLASLDLSVPSLCSMDKSETSSQTKESDGKESGPLPPSRRSLFTLAASMVLFSSKAFNLFSLADFTKAALHGPTLDPFLHLVEDHKLKAVNSDQRLTVAYGCEEDDASALGTLSNIAVSTEHSRGTLVYEIVKSLEDMCNLLTEFMPDDACPLGTRFLEDTQKTYQVDSGDVKPQKDSAVFSHEDQEFGDGTETVAKNNPVTVAEIPELLTVNQILESVEEATRQVGRISFQTAADASYNEMTLHCENLLMGKQQQISSLLNSQLRHESSVNRSPRQHDEEIKIATFHTIINSAFHTEVEVPLLGKELDMKSPRTPMGTIRTQCYSELQNNPQAFRLPA